MENAPIMTTELFDTFVVDNTTLKVKGRKPWFLMFYKEEEEGGKHL